TGQGPPPGDLVDLLLESYSPSEKIALIRLLRQLTGRPVGVIRSTIDSAPVCVLRGIPRAEAEGVRTRAVGSWRIIETSLRGPEIDLDQATPSHDERFDLVLRGYAADRTLAVIMLVRDLTDLGLKEAQEMAESLPKTILVNVKWTRIAYVRLRTVPGIVW